MADVNVGIITTIWSIQPLAAATLDYLIYGERLRMHHLIGMVFVIGSGLCISLSSKTNTVDVNLDDFSLKDLEKLDQARSPFLAGYPSGYHYDTKMLSVSFDPKVPKWVAVMFGLLTPVFFVASGLFIKHLTSPKVGFDAMTISFATSFFSSTLIIILGASWYWQTVAIFNTRLFVIGIFGSIFDSVGKACIQKAYSKGPAGPVSAFVELNNVFLVVFEAARYWKLPRLLELVGFVLGIFGALVLCIPDEIIKIFTACKGICVKKSKLDSIK
jgi:drug/metabolite transporter (DMT)-like permease